MKNLFERKKDNTIHGLKFSYNFFHAQYITFNQNSSDIIVDKTKSLKNTTESIGYRNRPTEDLDIGIISYGL